jgi:hypothetical protein
MNISFVCLLSILCVWIMNPSLVEQTVIVRTLCTEVELL